MLEIPKDLGNNKDEVRLGDDSMSSTNEPTLPASADVDTAQAIQNGGSDSSESDSQSNSMDALREAIDRASQQTS